MSSSLDARDDVELVQQFVVRCFAEQKEGQWQAFSVEYGLAAQADTFSDVRVKLDEMIHSYLEDALIGEDVEHGKALLERRGPLSVTLKYHFYNFLQRFGLKTKRYFGGNVFNEYIPSSFCHS